jgi:hypothetical protein
MPESGVIMTLVAFMSDGTANKLDEIGLMLKDLFNHLSVEGKRTAVLTRLRIELSGLDRQRRELYSKLGDKVNDLRMNGKIIDAGLVGLLQGEFEEIDRMTMKVNETMESIQKVNLEGREPSEEPPGGEEPEKSQEGLLDSFQVS